MELPLLYIVILLFNMLDFSSGIIYNKGTMEKCFSCTNYGHIGKKGAIKLFLFSKNMAVQCSFQSDNTITSKEFLSMFASGGLSPSLEIINSTYTGIFHFNLTLLSDQAYWLIDVPRENITENRDVAAVEEWLVRITFQHAINTYVTEGTLLDRIREPLLQWNLGYKLSTSEFENIQPHVLGITATKCPCANDVALVGLILNSTQTGIFVGFTDSGFWDYADTSWYDLSDITFTQIGEGYGELSVVDMVLTNHFLVILTSLGLFVSEDLRYPKNSTLRFSRADFCGFERDVYVKGKLWYNERCFANKEHFEVDYVTITFERNKTLSEESSCFYSNEPFLAWLPCLPHSSKQTKNNPSTVITFLIDQELNTGIYLFMDPLQKYVTASVNTLKDNIPASNQKFPTFSFPPSFTSPAGMVFHPRSHFLYVYGNQVWLSADGGNSFELLADFHNDTIMHTYHSFYSSDIIFVSKHGKVYLTKAGMKRYSELASISDKIFTLYYDHMAYIHKLTPKYFETGTATAAFGNKNGFFGPAPDMGFETALAPQYLTLNEMIFYAYVPANETKDKIHTRKFSLIHLGKMIQFGKTGAAYIKGIAEYNTSEGFLSSATAEITEPFGLEEAIESTCLLSSLQIQNAGNFYKLTLQLQSPGVNSSFQDTDIEKTVVIPSYSSFLITSILDANNALAIATMPKIVPHNMTFPGNSWFLYNFGQRHGRIWKIYSKPCNYWFQLLDNTLSLNVLKYTDLGESHTLTVKIIPRSKDTHILEKPPLTIIVGNPNLLTFKAEGVFDDTNSYTVSISATSKDLHQGWTSLALIVWGASTECFVSTFVPTLKSSCSYLKFMHHIPIKIIPLEDWTSGVHTDSQGFNMIKTLPINYRPPSNMGIAIPLTDHFYHADPSKPIPRNLFHKSKNSGKYKQCAGKSNREACNCTHDQKFSHAVAFSDCREKVPRFKFPVANYPISLKIHSEEGSTPLPTHYLITITEVNGRGNWKLNAVYNYASIISNPYTIYLALERITKQTIPEGVKIMKSYLEQRLNASVYNPVGLNLSIEGSELFHFKVSIVPGVTFCNFVDEFQIYVDEVPLPFPGHTLIAIASAVMLGGLIFTASVLQIRDIHPWDWCQNLIRNSLSCLPFCRANQVSTE